MPPPKDTPKTAAEEIMQRISSTFYAFGINIKFQRYSTYEGFLVFWSQEMLGSVMKELITQRASIQSCLDDYKACIIIEKERVLVEVLLDDTVVDPIRALEQRLEKKAKKQELPIFIGESLSKKIVCPDLAKIPHLMVMGAKRDTRLALQKQLVSALRLSKNSRDVVLNYLEKDTVIAQLDELNTEMERRYELLKNSETRNIVAYNDKCESKDTPLHYMVNVVLDYRQFVDKYGKAFYWKLARVAQLSKAVGIHLIVFTNDLSDQEDDMVLNNIPGRLVLNKKNTRAFYLWRNKVKRVRIVLKTESALHIN